MIYCLTQVVIFICRACAAADGTGHYMLHTLYGQAVKHKVEFFVDFFALDLLVKDDRVFGIIVWDLDEGKIHRYDKKYFVILLD